MTFSRDSPERHSQHRTTSGTIAPWSAGPLLGRFWLPYVGIAPHPAVRGWPGGPPPPNLRPCQAPFSFEQRQPLQAGRCRPEKGLSWSARTAPRCVQSDFLPAQSHTSSPGPGCRANLCLLAWHDFTPHCPAAGMQALQAQVLPPRFSFTLLPHRQRSDKHLPPLMHPHLVLEAPPLCAQGQTPCFAGWSRRRRRRPGCRRSAGPPRRRRRPGPARGRQGLSRARCLLRAARPPKRAAAWPRRASAQRRLAWPGAPGEGVKGGGRGQSHAQPATRETSVMPGPDLAAHRQQAVEVRTRCVGMSRRLLQNPSLPAPLVAGTFSSCHGIPRRGPPPPLLGRAAHQRGEGLFRLLEHPLL